MPSIYVLYAMRGSKIQFRQDISSTFHPIRFCLLHGISPGFCVEPASDGSRPPGIGETAKVIRAALVPSYGVEPVHGCAASSIADPLSGTPYGAVEAAQVQLESA